MQNVPYQFLESYDVTSTCIFFTFCTIVFSILCNNSNCLRQIIKKSEFYPVCEKHRNSSSFPPSFNARLETGTNHAGVLSIFRLRVVSNFGDRLWNGRDTRAHAKFRGDATRGERQKVIFGAPLASRLLEISRARVCVFRPPHNRHRQN